MTKYLLRGDVLAQNLTDGRQDFAPSQDVPRSPFTDCTSVPASFSGEGKLNQGHADDCAPNANAGEHDEAGKPGDMHRSARRYGVILDVVNEPFDAATPGTDGATDGVLDAP
jgi:hypothetical protein